MKTPTVLALYRYDFLSFVRFVFDELYPDKEFVEGWHIDVMADALMRCAPGGERRLIINVPPRYLKSLCASIAWPLFVLARHAGLRIVVCSGTRELAAEFNELRERLLKSQRLITIFGSLRFERITNGFRFANGSELVQTTVGRSQIGRGADIIIVDDPLSPMLARHAGRRAAINAWFDAEILPRLNSKKSAAVVVVMQRLAVTDLCGHLLAGNEAWRHLSLSAIARTDEEWITRDGTRHSRSAGDVLSTELEDKETLLGQLAQIGGLNFYAQYLQAPTDSTSGSNTRHVYLGRRPVPLDWKNGDRRPKPPIFPVVDLADDIRHEYFGHPHPYDVTQFREQTDEEWDQEFYLHQTALLASVRADRERRQMEKPSFPG